MEKIARLTPYLHVTSQLSPGDVGIVASKGYRSIINNRIDDETDGQPASTDIQAAAERHGLAYRHLPVTSGAVTDEDVARFADMVKDLKGPVLAFCRTGARSTTLWALHEASRLAPEVVIATAAEAGYDLAGLQPRLAAAFGTETTGDGAPVSSVATHDVVIVGGGAAGISAAASLRQRQPDLDVAIIEPSERHYYQPGWTLVGGGVFDRAQTLRPMAKVIPKGVHWIHAAAAAFEPERNCVVLEDGSRIGYRALVVAPGIKLNWDAIDGLRETLGKNGVTSNYQFDLAAYTWDLVSALRGGRAVFTQPPMPIKCAGAPQKAMYLSCDNWLRHGRLDDIEVQFHTAGAAIFGVADYVPALTSYLQRYGVDPAYKSNLVAIDGPARKAWFDQVQADGTSQRTEVDFDMIHVAPPQKAPDFLATSPLANDAGYCEVSAETLQHSRYGNIFGLGDACSAPNAKTAAAVRKQAPVVAANVAAVLDGQSPRAIYDGYGSCPLTVERGKIVLAEFGYGGKLLPTFKWLDGTRPSRFAWMLKEKMMPTLYWDIMLKGREWMIKPDMLPHEPRPHDAQDACDWEKEAKKKAS